MSNLPDREERLILLAEVSHRWRKLGEDREQLIALAISDGYSERTIGRSAGLSGPAINLRKRRLLGATSGARLKQ